MTISFDTRYNCTFKCETYIFKDYVCICVCFRLDKICLVRLKPLYTRPGDKHCTSTFDETICREITIHLFFYTCILIFVRREYFEVVNNL
uniref:SFRICE_006148 n=1 Tax=Spodoptera frugiperda TaxID=7108 RepID=A0A2H1W4W9_SPOFR